MSCYMPSMVLKWGGGDYFPQGAFIVEKEEWRKKYNINTLCSIFEGKKDLGGKAWKEG